MQKLLIILVTSLTILANGSEIIDSSFLILPAKGLEQSTFVIHRKNGFAVLNESGEYQVQNCFVDKELRNRTLAQIVSYLKHDNYLTTKYTGDGKYIIHGNSRLRGGGILGANVGWYLGKGLTYAVGHGSIIIAAALTGPAGFLATLASLEGQFYAPIEAASNTVALGMGIAGAASTGPV